MPDDQKLWGTPREVRHRDIPSKRARASMWSEMFEDVMLRLELTTEALAYPMGDERTAKAACVSLRKYSLRRGGKGAITMILRGDTLYICRGPNWARRGAGSLSHIAADPQDSPDWYETHQKRVARNGNSKGETDERNAAR